MLDPRAHDWLHPSALRAMVSYAKDVYINGHIELAERLFGEYAQMLTSLVSPHPEHDFDFENHETEIIELENQAANRLDYFGNPLGWAPTLSFAANYRVLERQVDSDIRTIFLAKLIQTRATDLQLTAQEIQKAFVQLGEDIDIAVSAFNDAQLVVPELESQLVLINARSEILQEQLQVLEAELRARAARNVEERNSVPGWQRAISVVSSIAEVVPIKSVSLFGKGLGAISDFLNNPSLSGIGTALKAGKGIADAFTKMNLLESKDQITMLIADLKPPTSLTRNELKQFLDRLSDVGKEWGDVSKKYTAATQSTEVPQSEIETEIQRLRAEDPTFNALLDELDSLVGQREVFAQSLSSTLTTISSSFSTIHADYAAAAALESNLGDITLGLRHDTVEQVREIERRARERLLKYQYYMARAYEYEFLAPFPGNFQLGSLAEAVDDILSTGADQDWLDNETRLDALKLAYEDDLKGIAEQVWSKLNINAPERTTEIRPRLSREQLATLNAGGEVIINLVEMGFIGAESVNAKLLEIGVDDVKATLSDPDAQLASIRFEFDHSGTSIVQSEGHKYIFRHNNSDADLPIFWATDYDAITGELTQAEIRPGEIASIAALLDLDPNGISLDQFGRLYAHPSVWANVTIRRNDRFVPRVADVTLEEVRLFVRYDAERPPLGTAILNVSADHDLAPRIAIDALDRGGRTDGVGNFVRYYERNDELVISAEPEYGRFSFSHWVDERGDFVSDSQSFAYTLAGNAWLHAVYLPPQGDFDSDGTVTGFDFLQWQREFGSAVWPAEGADGNGDGFVDLSDLRDWEDGFAASQDLSSFETRFFISPGANPNGDIEFQNAVTGLLSEYDFEHHTANDLVDTLDFSGQQVDVNLLNADGSLFSSEAQVLEVVGATGTVDHFALRTQRSEPEKRQTVEFLFAQPVEAFGLWIYDDGAATIEQFEITATLVDGRAVSSGTLDSGDGLAQGVEGFLGVISSIGVQRAVVEAKTIGGFELLPSLPSFQVDHIQISTLGPVENATTESDVRSIAAGPRPLHLSSTDVGNHAALADAALAYLELKYRSSTIDSLTVDSEQAASAESYGGPVPHSLSLRLDQITNVSEQVAILQLEAGEENALTNEQLVDSVFGSEIERASYLKAI